MQQSGASLKAFEGHRPSGVIFGYWVIPSEPFRTNGNVGNCHEIPPDHRNRGKLGEMEKFVGFIISYKALTIPQRYKNILAERVTKAKTFLLF